MLVIIWAGFLTIVSTVVVVAALETVFFEFTMPLVLDGLRCMKAVPNLVAGLATVVTLA